MSQQELGKALGLVPSAIVTSLDELKALHAIVRVEDPNDRRRTAPADRFRVTQNSTSAICSYTQWTPFSANPRSGSAAERQHQRVRIPFGRSRLRHEECSEKKRM